MDKKAWIILLICALGLAGNYWWAVERQKEWRAANPPPPPAQDGDGQVETPETPTMQATGGERTSPATEGGKPDGAGLTNVQPEPDFEEVEKVLAWQGEGERQKVHYVFTNRGGGIKRIEFPGDPQRPDGTGGPVVMNRKNPFAVGALSDGVARVETAEYQLVEDTPARITYEGVTYAGLRVRKTYTVVPPEGGRAYPVVELAMSLANDGQGEANTDNWYLHVGAAAPVIADEYEANTGWGWNDGGDTKFEGAKTFSSGWFSSAKDSATGRIEQLQWIGSFSQYYALLALPESPRAASWWAQPLWLDVIGRREGETRERAAAMVAVGLGAGVVQPGGENAVTWRLFAAPKDYEGLKQSGLGVQDAMLYSDMPIFGWMAGPFSRLLNWGMHKIADVVGAFGIAIIIVTILIRTAIWPLHAKAQRTMKRMALLNPKMQELKEKYTDDPQKMNQELMKLYRDYGVNPMGGCLPMLLQMPIFFGFYRMLQFAAELRHESFLWVPDLSQPDTVFYLLGLPVNVLPLLMAGTMILQMKMTPQTGDPTQRRIFMFMPLIFLFICYNFAAALSLYWTTQNIFSIGQTWLMQRQPDVKLEKKKRAPRPSLEELQRQMRGQDKPKKPKKKSPRTGG